MSRNRRRNTVDLGIDERRIRHEHGAIGRLLTACGSFPAGVNRSEAGSPPLVMAY